LQVGLNLRIQLLHVRHPPLHTAHNDEQEHSERYEPDVQDGKFTRRPHRQIICPLAQTAGQTCPRQADSHALRTWYTGDTMSVLGTRETRIARQVDQKTRGSFETSRQSLQSKATSLFP
jgi:hypothetical protein